MIDYMVMEAVALKVRRQEQKEAEDAERRRKVKEAQDALKKEYG